MNAKQQRFVEEYLIDLNATQAAIRAGYAKRSAEVAGCRLLRNDKIAAAIDKARAKQAEKAEISAQWVLDQLIANHHKALQLDQLPASNKALELVGKHLAMFTEVNKVEPGDGWAEIFQAVDGRTRLPAEPEEDGDTLH